jgi:hypothetical protein
VRHQGAAVELDHRDRAGLRIAAHRKAEGSGANALVWHSLNARLREGGALARFRGVDMLFSGRYFDREIILLCIRWYLRFKLSFRDFVEMMEERGLPMAHTTIMR